MNAEADYYASKSHTIAPTLLTAPSPTFFMDPFTFYRSKNGWIESNVQDLMSNDAISQTQASLGYHRGNRMASWLYNPGPHPQYPYIRAVSAYSALVQLYARSGQLPTPDLNHSRGIGDSRLCCFGCRTPADTQHIFRECRHFDKIRSTARGTLIAAVTTKMEEAKLPDEAEPLKTRLLHIAESFFYNNNEIWLLHYTAFYLGHVPEFNSFVKAQYFTSEAKRNKFARELHSEFHLTGIRLAGRIFAEYRREMASQNEERGL